MPKIVKIGVSFKRDAIFGREEYCTAAAPKPSLPLTPPTSRQSRNHKPQNASALFRYIQTCIYTHIYIYTYTHVYVHIYIYICIYTCTPYPSWPTPPICIYPTTSPPRAICQSFPQEGASMPPLLPELSTAPKSPLAPRQSRHRLAPALRAQLPQQEGPPRRPRPPQPGARAAGSCPPQRSMSGMRQMGGVHREFPAIRHRNHGLYCKATHSRMVAAHCLPQIRYKVALLDCVCAGQSIEGDPLHLRGDISKAASHCRGDNVVCMTSPTELGQPPKLHTGFCCPSPARHRRWNPRPLDLACTASCPKHI